MRIATILTVVTLATVAQAQTASAGWWPCRDKECGEKHHCCLCPTPAPRAEVAISFPGQVRMQADQKPELESQKEEQEKLAERVDKLEANLARLSLAVEKVSQTQEQTLANLTRLSLAVEKLAEAGQPKE